MARNLWVSPEDGFHVRIGSAEYFEILFDNNVFVELDKNMTSKDPLHFEDTKKYADRLKDVMSKTGLKDAVRTGVGKSKGKDLVVCCMDFAFIGGSMGAVVGEKIARGIDYSIKNKVPFVMISKSGGARMMEAAYSLMQLAKTSAKLAQLAEAKIPYISLCTDPTTGGTTASYAMLGDINILPSGRGDIPGDQDVAAAIDLHRHGFVITSGTAGDRPHQRAIGEVFDQIQICASGRGGVAAHKAGYGAVATEL